MRRKEKKTRRMRGSMTHGYGAKKKHRGKGSRGGKGMAGTGKRADVKRPSINPATYFGRHGFVSKTGIKRTPINVSDLISIVDKVGSGKIVLDLNSKGYNKLLGSGKVTHAFDVTVALATEKAKAKITAAGGKITETEMPSSSTKEDSEE